MQRIASLNLLIGALAALVPALSQAQDGQRLDSIVAVVNEGVVLESELDSQTEMILARLQEQNVQLPPPDVLRDQILERLIVDRIQLQRAERIGIRISDEMLNGAMAEVARRNNITFAELPRALQSQGIDYGVYREEMRDQLALEQLRQVDVLSRINVSDREISRCLEDLEQNVGANSEFNLSHILISVPANATAEQFREAEVAARQLYEQLRDGADFAQAAVTYSDAQNALEGGALGWRKGTELPTLFTGVVEGLSPGDIAEPIRNASGFHIIRLNDLRGALARSEVDQSRVRHILIRPDEIIDDATARQQLGELRERILAGESFADLAQLNSDDPGSAAEGGDLGWTSPGTFVPEFTEVAQSLEIGELSAPFRSRFGWHILEVTDRRVYDNTEEVRERNCIASIRAGKLEEETQLWLRRMRDEAFVDKRI
ncbi:MAG: peptidylprolyl isomerase [Gammaproteobacteria bacterium]